MGRSRLSYGNCLFSANVSFFSVLLNFWRPRLLFQRKYVLLWGEGHLCTIIALSPLMCHFLVSFLNFWRPRPLFQPKYVLVWEDVAFRTIIAFFLLMYHFLMSFLNFLRPRPLFQPKYVIFWNTAPMVRKLPFLS